MRAGVMDRILEGDAAERLREIADSSVDLVYMDPPFNTGKRQVGAGGGVRRSARERGSVRQADSCMG